MGMDRKVLGTVDTTDTYVRLLPGTPHKVHLHLEETLVVGNTDILNLLVGNRQMKPMADSLTQYPTLQLHLYSNLVDSLS